MVLQHELRDRRGRGVLDLHAGQGALGGVHKLRRVRVCPGGDLGFDLLQQLLRLVVEVRLGTGGHPVLQLLALQAPGVALGHRLTRGVGGAVRLGGDGAEQLVGGLNRQGADAPAGCAEGVHPDTHHPQETPVAHPHDCGELVGRLHEGVDGLGLDGEGRLPLKLRAGRGGPEGSHSVVQGVVDLLHRLARRRVSRASNEAALVEGGVGEEVQRPAEAGAEALEHRRRVGRVRSPLDGVSLSALPSEDEPLTVHDGPGGDPRRAVEDGADHGGLGGAHGPQAVDQVLPHSPAESPRVRPGIGQLTERGQVAARAKNLIHERPSTGDRSLADELAVGFHRVVHRGVLGGTCQGLQASLGPLGGVDSSPERGEAPAHVGRGPLQGRV
ncbi:Uncharacterised protein [Brevundimonas diminuta]|nr:Uncharacterised protein [Brevundimonas diminuta]